MDEERLTDGTDETLEKLQGNDKTRNQRDRGESAGARFGKCKSSSARAKEIG